MWPESEVSLWNEATKQYAKDNNSNFFEDEQDRLVHRLMCFLLHHTHSSAYNMNVKQTLTNNGVLSYH